MQALEYFLEQFESSRIDIDKLYVHNGELYMKKVCNYCSTKYGVEKECPNCGAIKVKE
jgi:hypothetical protein